MILGAFRCAVPSVPWNKEKSILINYMWGFVRTFHTHTHGSDSVNDANLPVCVI